MRYEKYKSIDLPWLKEIPEYWGFNRAKNYIAYKKSLNENNIEKNILSLTLKGVINNDKNKPIGLSPSDYSTYQIFMENDLVFKLIDLNNISTSRVGLVFEQGAMSSAYIRGVINIKKLNPKFIYYWYKKLYVEEVYNKLGSGVRETLNQQELFNMSIPIPPLSEQIQIAKFLDWKINEIDRLIKIEKEKIRELNQFLKMKIHNIIIDSKISNATWSCNVKKSEFIKLKRIVEFKTKKANNGLPYIGLENIESWNGHYSINTDVKEYSDAKIICDNQLGINLLRPYLAKVILSNSKYAVSSEVCVMEVKAYNTEFLKEIFLDYQFIEELNLSTYGAKMPRANWEFLKNMLIPLYDTCEQERKNKMIKIIRNNIYMEVSKTKNKIKLLSSLKKSLISEVVTGKINVQNIDIPIYDKVALDSEEELDIAEDEIDTEEGGESYDF